VLLAQHTAQGRFAVGLRSKNAAAVLFDRNDGEAEFFSSLLIRIHDHPRYPRKIN
jgi:hypothetical protein